LGGVHETRYGRVGRRISFSTEDHIHGGSVEVTGTCHGDELILDLRSLGRTLRDVRFRRIWPLQTDLPGGDVPGSRREIDGDG
jgi:hypothetical protein